MEPEEIANFDRVICHDIAGLVYAELNKFCSNHEMLCVFLVVLTRYGEFMKSDKSRYLCLDRIGALMKRYVNTRNAPAQCQLAKDIMDSNSKMVRENLPSISRQLLLDLYSKQVASSIVAGPENSPYNEGYRSQAFFQMIDLWRLDAKNFEPVFMQFIDEDYSVSAIENIGHVGGVQ